MGVGEKHIVKCPICGKPFVMVPGAGTSNACAQCTREAEKNSGYERPTCDGWKRR